MTALSPAAQAVLDAYCTEADLRNREVTDCEMLAAALRAAADQVVPEEDAMPLNLAHRVRWDAQQSLRRRFLAIAAELEGHD